MRTADPERPDSIPDTAPTAGYPWDRYLDHLVRQRGSLASVAEGLAELRGFRDDIASIERALRRLRRRALESGGVWGQRLLARYGLPDDALSRLRWMAMYHSRFTDLPVDACESLLRLWDGGPVRDSAARVWLSLGSATVALRRQQSESAEQHLAQAAMVLAKAPSDARVEWLLTDAFIASRARDAARVQSRLDEAQSALDSATEIDRAERACLYARLIDQRAFVLNHREGEGPRAEAERLYASIPVESAPPFALCRRESGLAYAKMKAGDSAAAIEHAERSARAAGDAGALRLRAMALLMLVKIKGPSDGASELHRARQIAQSLGDRELLARVERHQALK